MDMSTHDYQCKKCGEKFERQEGTWSFLRGARCPKCLSSEVEQVEGPASALGCCSPDEPTRPRRRYT